MDPVSIVKSALTLAISIKLWLEAKEEKEQVIRSLSSTTNRLCDVLAPFNDENLVRKLDDSIVVAFNGIKHVLFRTKEHLIAWGSKKPKAKSLSSMIIFFVPSQVTKALKEDEQDLNNQLVGMLFILAVNKLLKETNSSETQPSPLSIESSKSPPAYQEKYDAPEVPPPTPPKNSDPVQFLDKSFSNAEVRQFWSDYIGAKVTSQLSVTSLFILIPM
jgi:hypothetical protein